MDFLERLKQEKIELQNKYDKLYSFLYGEKGCPVEGHHFNLLVKQEEIMYEYLSVLEERLYLIEGGD